MILNEQTRKIYNAYKGKICFVTGGEGFIGRALVHELRNIGAFVVISYDLKYGNDICNYCELEDHLALYPKIDYVFHLAALTEVVDSYHRPYNYYETNVKGTLNILEAVRLNKIKSLVVASTDKVYGKQVKDTGFYEEDTLLPSPDPYSNSKRLADLLCQDYKRQYNLPIKILRSVNTYGPGQTNETTLITNSINRLLSGQEAVSFHNALLMKREWLYIDDAVQAYLLAGLMQTELKNYDNYGYIWNVGSAEIHTPLIVINKIMEKIGTKKNITIYTDNQRSTWDQCVNSRLFHNAMYRITEWTPTKLDEGLQRTIQWHQEKLQHGNNPGIQN